MLINGNVGTDGGGSSREGSGWTKGGGGVGGIDGASWSAGACTRRGARQASFCLFHDFKYSQIYYTIWD